MPVIDFENRNQYAAVIAFLAGHGLPFHTRPPQRIVVGSADFKALQDAAIIPNDVVKANGSRGEKTRSSSKPKAGGAR